MISDARREAPRDSLDCDLCIVGAGAAGITLALELAGSNLSICVLEAGGLDYDATLQPMLAGETGDSGYPSLHTARVAGLGGSMRIWAGWCRPLDGIDFEQREAIPHSGWPFGLDELRPYYVLAHEKLQLGPFDYDPAAWEQQSGSQRLPLPENDARSILFRRSPLNFGVSQRAALRASENVRLLTHANVLGLTFSPNGKAVHAVEAATLNDKRFEVRARAVVVAAGGIESARLLLLSAERAGGCGNERDLVGRYFTEHGYEDLAIYVPADARSLRFYFPETVAGKDRSQTVRGGFAPSAARMRRDGLLNCGMFFRPAHEAHAVFENPRVQAALELWDMLRSRAVPDRRFAKALYAAGAPHALLLALWRRLGAHGAPFAKLRLRSLFECAPDPSNRVILGDARDSLGRRVAKVQWRMRELDLRSVARTQGVLDASLRSAGLGQLQVRRLGDDGERGVTPGKHHLCTTRMHRDPTQGVADASSKVHGIDNLFVTGGSAFTTGGFANPTLTVVALALRLAAHLDRHLRRPH
jgi:choline dehydrogenase-like flavoprotein